MATEEFLVEDAATPPDPIKVVAEKKQKHVSFSQYAKWLKCPQDWKLSYIDKLSPYDSTIHTVFGTAIHGAIQAYLKILYTVGATEADEFDTIGEFKKGYKKELLQLKIATPEQEKLSEEELKSLKLVTEATIAEFESDGKTILNHMLDYSTRTKHFPSKRYELVGIELPLEIPLRKSTLLYKGFLDIVLKDKQTNKILILDFKTSTNGWNKYQKVDRTKIDQLLLYKRFYSQTFKVAMDEIEVEFFVLKRKLMEDVTFPQQRIQRISPPDGKKSMAEVETSFLDFIKSGFDDQGNYNKDGAFPKTPGKAKKNCKYCFFKTHKNEKGELYCNGKEDK